MGSIIIINTFTLTQPQFSIPLRKSGIVTAGLNKTKLQSTVNSL